MLVSRGNDVRNGTAVDSVAYGHDGDLSEDMNESAMYIDGFAGHLCDWHRVGPPIRDIAQSGWYSPISTAPCH